MLETIKMIIISGLIKYFNYGVDNGALHVNMQLFLWT